MKKGLLLICLFSFAQLLNAQLGLTAGYQFTHAPDWEKAIISGYNLPTNVDIFPGASYISIDWSFQSNKSGIQMLPEIHFTQFEFEVPFETEFINPISNNTDNHQGSIFSFMLNVDVFPLSFNRGSKNHRIMMQEENWWKDAVFIRLGLGIASFEQRTGGESLFFSDFEFGGNSFFQSRNRFQTESIRLIRWGIGFDANVSSFLTFSPMVQWTYSNRVNWAGIGQPSAPNFVDPFQNPFPFNNFSDPVRSQFLQTLFGIRMSVHFKKMSQHFKNLSINSSL